MSASEPQPNDESASQGQRVTEGGQTSVFGRILSRLGLWHPPSIRGDLEDALAEADTDTDFSPREREMLKNVLSLRAHRVDDVMVPRVDIIAVASDISLGELLRVFRTAGHSRLPVYNETLDDPRGMIHIRDFVDYLAARAEKTLGSRRKKLPLDAPDLGKIDLTLQLSAAKILRPVLFVPPSMPALDLLVKMQTTRTHMALVIDEYGGTDGLVSIEDLVEIVVGQIEDEHDLDETPMVLSVGDGTFIVDARANLEDVSRIIGFDLLTGDGVEDVDTIGGLIGMLAGRVPIRGEIIAGPATLEFEVLDADPRRLKRVRIQEKAALADTAVPPKRRRKSNDAEPTPPEEPELPSAENA